MSTAYETYRIDWQGIGVTIRWAPHWTKSSTYPIAHLELISDGLVKLPVTETGYRSHFTSREAVEDHGGPVAFAIAWLDHEAQGEAWQRQVEQGKQLSLF